MIAPRHTTIDRDPERAALQNSENARDVREAFALRPIGLRFTVERHTATGSTSTKIRIGSSGRPWAVRLARIAQVYAETDPVTCTPTLNFVWDSTTKAIDVFEPSGLVANTAYKMQFVVEEA